MAGKKKRDYSKTKRKDNGTPIQIRVSKELRATIERNAKACKLSISEYVRQVATMHNPRALPPEEFYQILDYLKVCKSNIEANQSWRFGKNELNTLIDLYNSIPETVFINADGTLYGMRVGAMSESVLESHIKQIIRSKE